jgi:hypothetical protein
MANNALARALFFRKKWQGFRTAAERALELNPLNGPTIVGLGTLMAYAGDWEHGCALEDGLGLPLTTGSRLRFDASRLGELRSWTNP